MRDTMNHFLTLLKEHGPGPVIVAHRGDSFHSPENTLEAARLARKAGAHAWELDVQLTRDGVPIVLHDESLVRTTDVVTRFKDDPRAVDGFRVSDFDFREVRALDAGSWFVAADGGARSARAFGTLAQLEPDSVAHFRSGGVTIPTLAEALRLTAELDWLVNVEIKSFPESPAGLVEKALDVIDQTGMAARVLISSFDHADVAAAGWAGRTHALGILTMTPLYRTHDYTIRLVGADTVHVSSEVVGAESIVYRRQPAARTLRTELIMELKQHHVPILIYTVNDHGPESLAAHLAELGIDGLFTDDPGGLKHYFDQARTGAHRGPR